MDRPADRTGGTWIFSPAKNAVVTSKINFLALKDTQNGM